MSPEFLVALSQQCWKGNIRELRNVIERSLIVCDGECLDVCDLPLEIQNSHYERSDEAAAPGSFELAAMERRHIARYWSIPREIKPKLPFIEDRAYHIIP